MDLNLNNYLLVGSYLMTAASWGFLYREIKSLRGEITQMRLQLAKDQGLQEGRDLEHRVARLEHDVAELRLTR